MFGFGLYGLSAPRKTLNTITNGGFDADAEWTKGTGWAISAGLANFASPGTAQNLSRSYPFVTGGVYEVTYTVLNFVDGGMTLRFDGVTPVLGTLRQAAGTFTQQLTAAAGNTTLVFRGSSTTTSISIDNVSIRRVA